MSQIYDIRLKSYRTELEEFQPSWDGSVKRLKGAVNVVTATSRDLDAVNAKYNALIDLLHRRLLDFQPLFHDLPDCQVNPPIYSKELNLHTHLHIVMTM